MHHRSSHTTKQRKAKCLHYRKGKRGGRVGKILINWRDRRGYHGYPVCQECADHITQEHNGETVETSPKGYHVITGLFDGSRRYRAIQ